MQTDPVLHVRHVSGLSGQSDGGALQASSYYSSPLISWRRLCSDREAAAQNSSDERRRQTSIILPACRLLLVLFFPLVFFDCTTRICQSEGMKKEMSNSEANVQFSLLQN